MCSSLSGRSGVTIDMAALYPNPVCIGVGFARRQDGSPLTIEALWKKEAGWKKGKAVAPATAL
jgi:hypothetical protein